MRQTVFVRKKERDGESASAREREGKSVYIIYIETHRDNNYYIKGR